jgi:hypothetical protein
MNLLHSRMPLEPESLGLGQELRELQLNTKPVREKPPTVVESIKDLAVLLYLVVFVALGFAFHGEGPGKIGEWLDCCAGLHVVLGFWSWYWPPLFVLSVGYQVMDSFGLNAGVSGHGAEPIEYTIGDCLEYLIGVILCIASQRLLPLVSLDPSVLWDRLQNYFWARRGMPPSRPQKPTRAYAVFHVVLNLGILSYLCVGLNYVPRKVATTDVVTRYKTYTRCCSNIHVALGPACWFLPPLLVGFLWFQLADSNSWNTEGTPFAGIAIEYIAGAAMASTASRVEPLWTIQPKVIKKRVSNLIWSRWGLDSDEDLNLQMMPVSSRETARSV